MTAVRLRDYQVEAINAARQAWAGGSRRVAAVLPTGSGKTVIFSALAAELHPLGVRAVILAHRDELIRQTVATARAVAPGLRVGVYQGATRDHRGRDIVVASVASLRTPERRSELAREGFRLVIVDECHHAVATTYVEALRALGCFDERDLAYGAAALGVTATLGRSDRVALGQVWQDVVYRRDIVQMIREGHLVNAKGVRVRVAGFDLARVKRTGGDFQDQALADAMHDALAPAAVARAYVEHAKDRSGVLFAPTVAMAHEMADALSAAGIPAVGLDGSTPIEVRRRILADHQRGDVQVICNCGVLTEGWDAPWCSAVVPKPTSSAGLYVQMAGRVLRPYPGKRDALVIDVVGVTSRHRLAGLVDLGGADLPEKLAAELEQYAPDDEIDLLGLLDPDESRHGGGWNLDEIGADGALTSEIVNLFGSSHSVWLRSVKGVWFLPAGKSLVFLAPGPDVGGYLVGRIREDGKGEWLVGDGVDLELAMTWGEQHAATFGGQLVRKGALWRKGVPTQGQVSMATALGLTVGDKRKGELSDEISRVLASGRLDMMPCVSTVTERGYW